MAGPLRVSLWVYVEIGCMRVCACVCVRLQWGSGIEHILLPLCHSKPLSRGPYNCITLNSEQNLYLAHSREIQNSDGMRPKANVNV